MFAYSIVVRKAYRVLGLICKSFECKDSDVMVKLYKTLVRPIIEYNNVLGMSIKLTSIGMVLIIIIHVQAARSHQRDD